MTSGTGQSSTLIDIFASDGTRAFKTLETSGTRIILTLFSFSDAFTPCITAQKLEPISAFQVRARVNASIGSLHVKTEGILGTHVLLIAFVDIITDKAAKGVDAVIAVGTLWNSILALVDVFTRV